MRNFLIVLLLAASAHAEDAPQCAMVLTQDELKAAVGESFDEVSKPVIYAEGHSQCSFFTAGGAKTVMVTFMNLHAIREGMISAETVLEFYEMSVRSREDVTGQKGQVLKNVGVRAALFREPEPMTALVAMKDGFAEIAAVGLTAGQLEAVAKAVAAPR